MKLVNNGGTVTVESAGPSIEMVNLGLPSGRLWAKTNLGASSETDYGYYFQWAATEPLHVEGEDVDPAADWALCPYTTDGKTFAKYNGSDFSTLQAGDDVVTATYGGSYRMPTSGECQELIDGTDNEWTSINGVNGYKFMKKSNHSIYIFIPAAGYCGGVSIDNVGDNGAIWSSSLNESDVLDESGINRAYCLNFYEEEADLAIDLRLSGHSVRAVL